ncbi:MAG: PH domain-containing protein [Deltaproteobacteria bacterium]|jgi:hypothetical protein|nr:PH domain-containing protein [Deltaproteobacteria bacterium]
MDFYPDDLPDYIAEKSHFGHLKVFGIKNELRFFSSILTDNEEVLALTRGYVDGRWWLMAVTDIRVVLVHRGIIYGLKYLEVPIAKIKSVSYKTGLFFGTIYIDTGAGTVVLDSVNKQSASEVSNILCEAIGESVQALPNGTKSTALLNHLERLAALKDKGILTDSEFLAQKEKILSGGNLPSRPPKARSKVETLPEPEPKFTRRPPEVKGDSKNDSPADPKSLSTEKLSPSSVGTLNKSHAPVGRPYPNKKQA